MSNHKKRMYTSEVRQTQAAQTRARILDAAGQLFQSEGFECVTIEKLAHVAKVSSPTIYSLFQSKRGILHAIIDEALPPDQYEALVAQAHQEKSVKKRLLIAAKISRQLYDAERNQMNIFKSASILAPELKELEQEREQRRYQRLEKTIQMMATENSLQKGLNLSTARDILWAFTGRDLYRMLVIEQGWTSEEYEIWLAQLLVKTLSYDESLPTE